MDAKNSETSCLPHQVSTLQFAEVHFLRVFLRHRGDFMRQSVFRVGVRNKFVQQASDWFDQLR